MMLRNFLFFTLITVFLVGIAGAADPNLVGWYKFDETSGTDAVDSSGYGNDATVSSSGGWDTSGYDGGCLNFDATFSVSVPAAVFADVNEQVTISVWVNGDTAYPETSQVPFHGSSPLKGRALRAEVPGGYNAVWFAAGDTTASANDGYDQGAVYNLPKSAYQGSWNNFTFVKNNLADVNEPTWLVYWNGLQKATRTDLRANMGGIDTFTIGSTNTGGIPYHGKLDEFRIYDRALSRGEIAEMFGVDPNKATNPSPMDGEEEILADVTLRWDAGLDAASHDVYLGTDETVVENATTASAEYMGNFVDAEYDPCSLDPNGLYFWRVDEVNDVKVWTGDVWSFRVMPPLPPLPDPILWLKMDGPDPENARLVRDSSGNGMDGTMGSSDVWEEVPGLGSAIDFHGGSWGASGIVFDVNDPNDILGPAFSDEVTVSFWCTYDEYVPGAQYPYDGRRSDSIRVLSNECPTNTHIRNHCGTKDIWVWGAFSETSGNFFFRDGGTWGDYQRLTTTVDLTTGKFKMYIDNELYTSQTVSTGGSLDGANAIKTFTVGRTLWAEMDGHMTDFRLFNKVLEPDHIAELVGDYPKMAKVVSPVHESTGHPLDVDLQWRAGKESEAHDVYFGENYSMVKNADTSSSCYMGQQTETTYDPCGLELMKTYYWRIDEVDAEGGIMEGPVWQFDTIAYVMIEDFESYDDEGNSITAVWDDIIGWGDMQISLQNDPCLSPVNSMRLRYHVPYDPYYAIAARSFSPAQDWTVNGVKMLTINCYGDGANYVLPMFITIGDGTTDANIVVDYDPTIEDWVEVNISLPEIAAAGVDLTNISYMEIGFGDGTNWGMPSSQYPITYIDDIALYPPKCVLSESSLDADLTADCVVDYDDLVYITDGWLRGSSADNVAAANPVGLWLFDDETDLTKATIGNDLVVDGADPVVVAGLTAGDGAAQIGVGSYYKVNHGIAADPTKVNEYSLLWDLSVPTASFTDPLRWIALCEYDTTQTTDADLSINIDNSEIGRFGANDTGYVSPSADAEDLIYPERYYQLVCSVKNGEFFKYYINGKLVLEGNAQAVDGRFGIESELWLFRDDAGEDLPLDCSTFAVFDRALTADEIKSLVPIQMIEGDLNDDTAIDFKDYSILANEWLVEDLWP